ncbi:MAG: DUF4386 domain-containing protein [Actinomycetota bacterium]|nr:MAG: hypothetical protein FD171_247 [Actinomycetota bacterium]MDO8949434.1 DUF4386 domain-containing protein [Actinomycetota bacterium]MDP3631033.1 DUF4386 domain-containing protein [Actinomycetota bacterium]
MTSTRRAAITAGVLFLVGTAAGVLSIVGAVDGPNYLRETSANGTQVVVGALFQLVTAGAYAGVAVALHPVLRRYGPTAATGFLGFRISAGILNMVGALILLLLLDLSSRFVGAGAPVASYFETLGSLLRSARDGMNHVAMILALIAGDAMYYWVLYRARLVPRWLSGWGFVGLSFAMSASLLVMCRLIEVVTPTYLTLTAVLGLQQLALAVWLVVKGFDESAMVPAGAQ